MFMLERLIQDIITFEDGSSFTDEHWKRLKRQFNNKQEVRNYINEKYNDEGSFRMVHPNGSISDPMKIKLQGEPKKLKPKIDHTTKNHYRIADDYEPIIMPKNPIGRMRFIVRAIRGEE